MMDSWRHIEDVPSWYWYQRVTCSIFLSCLFSQCLTDSREGCEKNISVADAFLQSLLSRWSEPRYNSMFLAWLSARCLDFCPVIVPKCPRPFVLRKEMQKNESPASGVAGYASTARPAARPGEPDLAAQRLRRVKHCTQRSSLHLYAPYIGRLLLQPTGTWLLAS